MAEKRKEEYPCLLGLTVREEAGNKEQGKHLYTLKLVILAHTGEEGILKPGVSALGGRNWRRRRAFLQVTVEGRAMRQEYGLLLETMGRGNSSCKALRQVFS